VTVKLTKKALSVNNDFQNKVVYDLSFANDLVVNSTK